MLKTENVLQNQKKIVTLQPKFDQRTLLSVVLIYNNKVYAKKQ